MGTPQHAFHGDLNAIRRELERLLKVGREQVGQAPDDGESIPLADLRQEHSHGPLSGFYVTKRPLVGRYLVQLVIERDGHMEVGGCRRGRGPLALKSQAHTLTRCSAAQVYRAATGRFRGTVRRADLEATYRRAVRSARL